VVILKKDLLIAILATFCITAILFTAIPIRSTPGPGEYDPWIDTNDDGILNYEDLFNLASRYGTFGTPINKTDLLLQLQSKIDSLNATLISLTGRVEALEAPESVTTERLANDSVTSVKLASEAIPHATRYSTYETSRTSTEYGDMIASVKGTFPFIIITYMTVTVTVERPSLLWIMFSTQARNDGGQPTWVRAWINDAEAAGPAEVRLTSSTSYSSYACNFIYSANTPGSYSIMIQWKVDGGTGYVDNRALAVIALPT